MKKKYIVVTILILLLAGILIYMQVFMKATSSTESEINYDSNSTSVDFSNYTTTDVNLDETSNKYSITQSGVYHFTGSLDGYIEVNTTNKVEIILDNVTITNSNGPCIYVIKGDTTINLVGESTLTDGSSYSDFTDVDGCIYGKDDLTFTGSGTLNLTSNYLDGIVSKDALVIKSGTYNITSKDDGIRGKDSVVIEDGTFNITAGGDGIKSTNDTDSTKGYVLILKGTYTLNTTNDGIQAETNLEIDDGTFNIKTKGGSTVTYTGTESAKGLKAGSNLYIKNINLDANTLDDSIHSNNTITIDNGVITISSGDDGIHADTSITINNGTITINKSYEGIESNNITINNGTIKVTSSDDGININGGNDSSSMGRPGSSTSTSSSTSNVLLTINGGTIYVNAGGDGLDSNGSIIMNGGTVYVDGPTDNGNGALDYNNTFTFNGGTLVAAGSSGMAQNVSTSTVGSVIIYFSSTQSAGTKIQVGDVTYTPSKNFSSIVVASSNFTKNSTYSILVNGSTYSSVTFSSLVTSVGTNSSSGMMGGRR